MNFSAEDPISPPVNNPFVQDNLEQTQSLPTQTNSSNDAFKKVSILLGLLLVLVSGGFAYYVINKQTGSTIPTSPETLSQGEIADQQLIASPSPLPESAGHYAMTYIKNDKDVFLYDFTTKEELQLTTDSSTSIRYSTPKITNSQNVSYVKCSGYSQDGKSPYTCSVQIHDLKTKQVSTVVSHPSTPNDIGSQIGGEIQEYAWSKSGSLAYLAYTAGFEGKHLFLLPPNQSQDKAQLLGKFEPNPGRGGSPNDELRLSFSEDESHLLLVDTLLQPASPGKEPSTAYIYRLGKSATPELIWHAPNLSTTFGRWISNSEVIFKQQSPASPTSSLIKVNTATSQQTVLGDAQGWNGMYLATPDQIIFWKISSGDGNGAEIGSYTVSTKTQSILKPKMFSQSVGFDNKLVVQNLVPCKIIDTEMGCGINLFNGFDTSDFHLLDIKTGETELLFPYSNRVIYGLNVGRI